MVKIPQQIQETKAETMAQYALSGFMNESVYLSPDALMSYCATRLRGIDDQVQTAFAKQERDNADSQVLSTLSSSIQLPTEDPVDLSNNDNLDSVGEGAQDYMKDLADKFDKAADSVSDPQLKQSLHQQATTIREDIQNGKKLTAADVKGLTSDAVGKFQQDLNSGAELSMINLQSLMSQRQQAIQVCTNLVQSLGDQCNKIAENVGH